MLGWSIGKPAIKYHLVLYTLENECSLKSFPYNPHFVRIPENILKRIYVFNSLSHRLGWLLARQENQLSVLLSIIHLVISDWKKQSSSTRLYLLLEMSYLNWLQMTPRSIFRTDPRSWQGF